MLSVDRALEGLSLSPARRKKQKHIEFADNYEAQYARKGAEKTQVC